MSEDIQSQNQSETREAKNHEFLKVVYVDDENILRRTVPTMFEGYLDDIEVFATPEEAIKRFEEDEPNVLMTDGNLGVGKMTGLQLALQIKSQHPLTTTVLYSGGIPNVNLNDPEVLKEYKIDIYLAKPAHFKDFRALPGNIRKLREEQRIAGILPERNSSN